MVLRKVSARKSRDRSDFRFKLGAHLSVPTTFLYHEWCKTISQYLQIAKNIYCILVRFWKINGHAFNRNRSLFSPPLRLHRKSASCVCVLKVARSRARFFRGDRDLLLYTGRAHFFNRYCIRGIHHLIFYSLPECPQFYPEMVNLLEVGLLDSKFQDFWAQTADD